MPEAVGVFVFHRTDQALQEQGKQSGKGGRTGSQTEIILNNLEERVTNLETTVNGRDASGTPGTEDYQPPVQGLVQKTNQIKNKIDNAVTTWEGVVEKELDENGHPTQNLAHGDDLVKSSAVYAVAAKLAQHIADAENRYLQVAAIELDTALTPEQREYLKGDISN